MAAGELRVGENLHLADDTTRRVESLTRREIRETVYNIEVDGEHVFYVGDDGVLVHNSCPKPIIRGPHDYYPGSGKWAHSKFGKWLRNKFPGIRFIVDRAKKGSAGIDIELRTRFPGGLRDVAGRKRGGFDHIELKPFSSSGLQTFRDQLITWRANGLRGNVGLFMYHFDANGNPIFTFVGVY